MNNDTDQLLERLDEVQAQMGSITHESIVLAHYVDPDRYPDYATVYRRLGGIRNVRHVMAKNRVKGLALEAYLQTCIST
jgi:hypothetical protein